MGEVDKIRVREFKAEIDTAAVEEMERQCDVGPATTGGKDDIAGKKKKKKDKRKEQASMFCDNMGDPLCRVRHSPDYVMLVAEHGKEMVGVIRASIKTVTRGRKDAEGCPVYAKVAYILGLRVSPNHRRMGIASRLVEAVEECCRKEGAEYAYMATERSNTASLNLFTAKFSYTPFRFPSVLVQPVHAHPLTLMTRGLPATTILRLSPALAEPLYRRLFSTSSEFFPKDIGAVLANPLTLGTFMAVPSSCATTSHWDPRRSDTGGLPPSFAVMSVWNNKDVYKMQVKGASAAAKALVRWARAADERMPWMGIPSMPDVFRPFGVYLMYGLHAEGGAGPALVRCLCRLAHNMAREDPGCAAVVAEVGRSDPVRAGVPHWRRLSWDEDFWCMKRLSQPTNRDGGPDDYADWVRSQPSTDVVFVDPRDF
ncbi:hypothetical protein Taro_003150 [Colocasia esculenta]|uniref:N-acetyltransferase domain-containing protein n=1 Tax=Colocasia esculenta TaxID=4460 RepID=A0A843TEQ0_COLES|nr:hypothetical protein [Colocasia esculenta]